MKKYPEKLHKNALQNMELKLVPRHTIATFTCLAEDKDEDDKVKKLLTA